MRERRGSLGEVARNFREYDAPFHSKLRMFFANNWTKLKRRDDCCGNDGQPGC